MVKLLQGAGCVKALSLNTDPFIRTVGYNDLKYFKPQQSEWIQDHFTVHFVFSGSGYLKMAGREHRIYERQLFIIPPDTPMMYYPRQEDIWKYLWFSVGGDRAEEMLSATGASPYAPVIAPANGQYIYSLLSSLLADGHFPDDHSIHSAFHELMHCITSSSVSRECEIKQAVDLKLSDPEFSVSGLCSEYCISHAQLCRIFHKSFGCSPKEYIIGRRMERAKELLKATDHKLSVVALSSGYSDCTHFMKEFKRLNGITASEYRHGSKQDGT